MWLLMATLSLATALSPFLSPYLQSNNYPTSAIIVTRVKEMVACTITPWGHPSVHGERYLLLLIVNTLSSHHTTNPDWGGCGRRKHNRHRAGKCRKEQLGKVRQGSSVRNTLYSSEGRRVPTIPCSRNSTLECAKKNVPCMHLCALVPQ